MKKRVVTQLKTYAFYLLLSLYLSYAGRAMGLSVINFYCSVATIPIALYKLHMVFNHYFRRVKATSMNYRCITNTLSSAMKCWKPTSWVCSSLTGRRHFVSFVWFFPLLSFSSKKAMTLQVLLSNLWDGTSESTTGGFFTLIHNLGKDGFGTGGFVYVDTSLGLG